VKEPTIRFYLEPKSKIVSLRTKPELVMAAISACFVRYIDGKPKYDTVNISTKCSILPKEFGKIEDNFKFDLAIFNKNNRNQGLKTQVGLFTNAVDFLHSNYLKNKKNPSASEFETELNIHLGITKPIIITSVTILSFLQETIKEFIKDSNTAKKNAKTLNTIKPYSTLERYILEFQLVKNEVLTFQNFDKVKYWDFWDFQDDLLSGIKPFPKMEGFKKRTIQEYGFSVNGIIKYQKTLVSIIKKARTAKINVAIDIDDVNLILEEQNSSKNVYVNEDNIQKIIDYVPISADMIEARNYAILASLFGMRHESMVETPSLIVQHVIDSKFDFKFIHSKQNKTGTECFVPILAPALNIINENGGKLPIVRDNATTNRLIKLLFKDVGIHDRVIITNYTYKRGNLEVITTLDQVITTHDFRSSFKSILANRISDDVIESILHPEKGRKKMDKLYDHRNMLDKVKAFVLEVKEFNKNEEKRSEIYTL
jgi:integrase